MKEQLRHLFERYLDDDLSEDEWVQLRGLIDQSDPQLLAEGMSPLFDKEPLPFSEQEGGRERVFESVSRMIDKREKAVRFPEDKKDDRRWWPQFLVAASLILLLGTGAWLFFQHSFSRGDDTKNTASTPLLPPQDARAWLTLADGRKVALATQGQSVVQQSDSVIRMKLQHGEGVLDYQGGGSPDKQISGRLDKQIAGSQSRQIAFNTLSTSRGIQYQLILPDGSHVWLNSASSIRYPVVFAGGERVVELNGEAYFEIKPDAKAPFRVKVNKTEVTVLGTAFDVLAYSDEPAIRTTLFQGGVRVIQGGRKVVLKPGEQAVASSDGDLTSADANLDEVAAWRKGEMKFKRRSIEEIMRQMSRWYDVEVEYRGPKPTDKFSGTLSKKQDASQLLEILQETRLVHFTTQGKKIIVSR